MPIQQIAEYQVKSSAVDRVTPAIQEFVRYVKSNEAGTRLYAAWQQKGDPTRFAHFFIFENKAAQTAHSESNAVKRFESVYSPELVGGDVVFTDYEVVATNQDPSPASTNGAESGRVVAEFYDAVTSRNLDVARRYLSDHLRFVGLFETYTNSDEYLKALAQLLSVTVRLVVRRVIAQGNDAAVFFELETKPPVKATTFVAEWHQVKDGRIVHVESAFDGRPFEAMFTAGKRT